MPETLLQAVLELIDQLESVVIPRQSIAHYSADQLSQLTSAGILQETSNATEIPRPERFGPGPDLFVHKTAHGIEGVADEDDYFPPIPLADDDVRQYAVSIPALVEKIRSDNGIEGGGFLDEHGLFHIGQKAFAGGAVDVYLSLPNDSEDTLLTRCRRLASDGGQRRIVLLTPRSVTFSTEGRTILESRAIRLVALMSATSRGCIMLDLDHVLGTDHRPTIRKPATVHQPRRRGEPNPIVQRIKREVRGLRAAKLDYRSICQRLGSFDRPPRASWRALPWPTAYMTHTSAVTKWLSEACSDRQS